MYSEKNRYKDFTETHCNKGTSLLEILEYAYSSEHKK